MRPAAMTGDDHPLPGIGVFHPTLLVALKRIGTPVAVDVPCPVGPRNCGQIPFVGLAADTKDPDSQSIDDEAADNASQEHTVFIESGIETISWI